MNTKKDKQNGLERLIEVVGKECTQIDLIANSLSSFSESFFVLGNRDFAIKMSTLAQRLESASKNINGATGGAVSEFCNRSVESTNNMVKAALSGIVLGKKRKVWRSKQ